MDWRIIIFSVLVIASCLLQQTNSTCVFDSDFGFTLNCGFKKSGIFRVRNLGGVKGYVGLGFSVGDELGFPQSLSASDTTKRRSTTGSRTTNHLGVQTVSKVNGLPRGESQVAKTTNDLGVQSVTTVNGTESTVPAPDCQHFSGRVRCWIRKLLRFLSKNGVGSWGKEEVKKGSGRSMSGMSRSPVVRHVPTVPPFKPIMPAANTYQHMMAGDLGGPMNNTRPSRLAIDSGMSDVPAFQALPASITKLQAVSPTVGVQVVPSQQALRNSLQAAASNRFQVRHDSIPPIYDNGLGTNSLTLRSGPPSAAPQLLVAEPVKEVIPQPLLTPNDGLMGHSIKALAQASNLSVEAITAAIAVRQQQLLKQQEKAMLAATTTQKPSTTLVPSGGSKKYALTGVNKVMNAPKEYYPVGYDKNFDDNFASRVELPDTSFYCGDQKHFPGLYSDEDLGCMVFHVCAFTDDGLIMKSFLCPESTLFDQTILKCNWWFYVDCKSSKKLYDSNIPISKSYQLMKALAFFSAYKKS